jgi:hypothetical protein
MIRPVYLTEVRLVWSSFSILLFELPFCGFHSVWWGGNWGNLVGRSWKFKNLRIAFSAGSTHSLKSVLLSSLSIGSTLPLSAPPLSPVSKRFFSIPLLKLV